MSANTPAAAAPPKAKSKKLIVILAAVVVLLAVAGAAAWFLLANRHHADDEDAPKETHQSAPKTPPTFLPVENMVVNLADPGGDRFAQIGITLELADAKTEAAVKQYMPSIRSGILMLVSQRTTEELLTREGKEKLAVDIRREVSRPLGYTIPKPRKKRASEDEEEGEEAPRPKADTNPVQQVLFSSFIIQ